MNSKDQKGDLLASKKEIFKKTRESKSVEELKNFLDVNGFHFDTSVITQFYNDMHRENPEVTDDELDNVTGGGCGDNPFDFKESSRCVWCKSKDTRVVCYVENKTYYYCNSCGNSWIIAGKKGSC